MREFMVIFLVAFGHPSRASLGMGHPRDAFQALRTIRVVEVDLGNGRRKRCVTQGSSDAKKVLKALQIQNTSPPTPPDGDWTVVL